MRTAALGTIAGIILAAASLPAAAQVTTRIETRPFYGAVVTIEEGVRVFRPLPPHDRVIINPEGKTPISLGFNQSYNYSYGQNYVQDAGAGGYGPYGAYNWVPSGNVRMHNHPVSVGKH
jgi:hypothetical protein